MASSEASRCCSASVNDTTALTPASASAAAPAGAGAGAGAGGGAGGGDPSATKQPAAAKKPGVSGQGYHKTTFEEFIRAELEPEDQAEVLKKVKRAVGPQPDGSNLLAKHNGNLTEALQEYMTIEKDYDDVPGHTPSKNEVDGDFLGRSKKAFENMNNKLVAEQTTKAQSDLIEKQAAALAAANKEKARLQAQLDAQKAAGDTGGDHKIVPGQANKPDFNKMKVGTALSGAGWTADGVTANMKLDKHFGQNMNKALTVMNELGFKGQFGVIEGKDKNAPKGDPLHDGKAVVIGYNGKTEPAVFEALLKKEARDNGMAVVEMKTSDGSHQYELEALPKTGGNGFVNWLVGSSYTTSYPVYGAVNPIGTGYYGGGGHHRGHGGLSIHVGF